MVRARLLRLVRVTVCEKDVPSCSRKNSNFNGETPISDRSRPVPKKVTVRAAPPLLGNVTIPVSSPFRLGVNMAATRQLCPGARVVQLLMNENGPVTFGEATVRGTRLLFVSSTTLGSGAASTN